MVREIRTGRETSIFSEKYATHTGEGVHPVFSAGGKRLAFAWFNSGPKKNGPKTPTA